MRVIGELLQRSLSGAEVSVEEALADVKRFGDTQSRDGGGHRLTALLLLDKLCSALLAFPNLDSLVAALTNIETALTIDKNAGGQADCGMQEGAVDVGLAIHLLDHQIPPKLRQILEALQDIGQFGLIELFEAEGEPLHLVSKMLEAMRVETIPNCLGLAYEFSRLLGWIAEFMKCTNGDGVDKA